MLKKVSSAPVGNIVLFNGTTINIAGEDFHVIPHGNDEKEGYSEAELLEALKVLTVSMSRIGRWNGHLRIPARLISKQGYQVSACQTFTNGIRIGKVPANRRFMFYSVMHHVLLVKDIVLRLLNEKGIESLTNGYSRELLVLQALLHEIGETIISDIPGPLKKLIRGFIKPIENNIEAVMSQDLGIIFPWAPLIKRADMLAQDIEGFYGYDQHVPGVNISKDFEEESWMLPALAKAVMISPDEFFQGLLSAYRGYQSKKLNA